MFRRGSLGIHAVIVLVVLLHARSSFPADAQALSADELAMLPIFAEVLRSSGFGLRSVEAAAFVVRDELTDVSCVRWPASARRREQNYSGPVPGRTLAVVHTHPLALRQPSRNDIDQARRIGLPFYVLSRDAIWVARPDGSIREVFRGAKWWRAPAAGAEPGLACMSTSEFVIDAVRRGVRLEWREARGE